MPLPNGVLDREQGKFKDVGGEVTVKVAVLETVGGGDGATETTLLNVLTELGQKTEPADAQNIRALTFAGDKVDASGSVVALDGPSLAALENITVTVSSEVEIKNDAGSPVPVSASSLPLPTGAATEAKQDAGNTSLDNIDTALASGTFATEPTLSDIKTRIDSFSDTYGGSAATRGVALIGWNGLSFERIDAVNNGLNVNIPATAATSALQTTGNTKLDSILTELQLKADLNETQPVSISGSVPVTGPLTDAQLRAVAVPISGTVTANAGSGTFAVSGPITDAQIRATPLPVSGTVTSNDGGTKTTASAMPAGGVGLMGWMSAIYDKIIASLAVTQSGTWTVQPGNTPNTTAWKVDGSAVTQPVSASSLPLPTGASTSVIQTNGSQKTQVVDVSGTVIGPFVTISGTNYAPVVLAASVTPGGSVATRSIQISGSDGTNAQTFSVDTSGRVNVKDILNSTSSTQGTISVTTSATAARVGGSNLTNRKNLTAYNDGTATLYWGYTNAVTSSTGIPLAKGQALDISVGDALTIYLISASGSHTVRVAEGA